MANDRHLTTTTPYGHLTLDVLMSALFATSIITIATAFIRTPPSTRVFLQGQFVWSDAEARWNPQNKQTVSRAMISYCELDLLLFRTCV